MFLIFFDSHLHPGNWSKELFDHIKQKNRIFSIIAGTSFLISGIFILIIEIVAILEPSLPSPIFKVGKYLINSFDILAYALPLYLFFEAIIFLLPGFKKNLLYFLTTSVIPFSILVLLRLFMISPEYYINEIPLLKKIGISNIGILGGILFLFSILMILVFRNLILGRQKKELNLINNKLISEIRNIETKKNSFLKYSNNTQVENIVSKDDMQSLSVKKNQPFETVATLADKSIPNKCYNEPKSSNNEKSTSPHLINTMDEENISDLPIPVFLKTRATDKFFQPAEVTKTIQNHQTTDMPDSFKSNTNINTSPKNESQSSDTKSVQTREVSVSLTETSIPPEKKAKANNFSKKDYLIPTGILKEYPDGQYWVIDEKTRSSSVVLRQTLAEFNIDADVTGIRKGPVVTMFEILPAPGVKLSKIVNLADNIALRLAASSIRIVAPIPGKHAVGIEVPNEKRSIVSFREIVESDKFQSAKMEIPVALGKDISGEAQVVDLVQTPHLLIAGATGSGKSVCVNSIILSLLFKKSPQEVRLILIDPKIVELKLYNNIPHLLTQVITEPKKAFQALQYCICEMERRYSLLDRLGVRDICGFNRKISEKKLAQEKLPYMVVIIDEFADLMATTGKELESTLARLAAMSRAVGIHLVLATQRPSIDVITGLIKANIPSRIAFMVAGKFDSRIIIDSVGAEKLLGRGDMLFSSAWDPFPIRMQGAYISEEEVECVVENLKQFGEPNYIDDEIFFDDEDNDEISIFDEEADDPLFEKALEIILQQGKASASFLQRRLKIGYNRAARIVELMEEKGIVGPSQGSKPRNLVRNPEITSN